MSLETLTFTDELRKLDAAHESLKESEGKLRNFILSSNFLADYITFEQLLGDFQNRLVTIVEITQSPLAGLPQQPLEQAETPKLSEAGEKAFTLEKALVAVAAIAACAITVQHGLLPPAVLAGVAFTSIILMFLPQVRSIITSLLSRKEEEEEEAPTLKLEDWINETLAKIRDLYTAARFLVKVQNQTRLSLPNYGVLGMDEALFDRSKFFKETLPSDFLSRIGRIMVAVDKNVWARKSLLVSAIVQSKQASLASTGRAA